MDPLPEGQNFNYQHMLDEAVQHGSLKGVKYLLAKHGVDPNIHRMPNSVTPLFLAAGHNRIEIVRYLLEEHAMDLHLGSGRYANGPTALWIAINLKAVESVALLLQHGGPMEHVDEDLANLTEPANAVVIASFRERAPVRLVTAENAKEYSGKEDSRRLLVELSPDDKMWLQGLQKRRPDEELRERGTSARWLDEAEQKVDDPKEDDRRLLSPEYITFVEREEELEDEDDVMYMD